jgi:hypothetical protein
MRSLTGQKFGIYDYRSMRGAEAGASPARSRHCDRLGNGRAESQTPLAVRASNGTRHPRKPMMINRRVADSSANPPPGVGIHNSVAP